MRDRRFPQKESALNGETFQSGSATELTSKAVEIRFFLLEEVSYFIFYYRVIQTVALFSMCQG